MSRICVTGIGVISAIGNSARENQDSLSNGICGLSRKTRHLESKFNGQLPFGEINLSTPELRKKLNADTRGFTRTTLIALHAFQEAIIDAELSQELIRSPDTAFIGASTVGGMCLTNELYRDANTRTGGSEYVFSYDCASANIQLSEKYRMEGINNTINTACSSSANAVMYGARLIRHGLAERAIVGGVDSLAKFTINGFNALFILSQDNCRPFDAERKGLNLGEGAAYLVLEKEEDCRNKRVYGFLTGYGNSNDAFHPSSLSEDGDGPFLSMRRALDEAGLQPAEIDYINAHGTGTENNDEVESQAIIRLFENPPAFTSTKSNTGHTLGAAGSLEAIYSIFNLNHQEIYPAMNFEKPIPGKGLRPVIELTKAKIDHVMSNSFGFGGNCTSLIFSKA